MLVTDLVQIRRQGEKNREENLRFRRHLKSHNYVERQFRNKAEEIQDQIDCRTCGECCRVTEVQLVERDAEKLAKFLGISLKEFYDKHAEEDENGKPMLVRVRDASGKPGACEFLVGNECTVYEARPGNCEKFPHLLKGMGSMEARMWQMVDRATYCPIVYNWMEAVKALTNFKPSATSKR